MTRYLYYGSTYMKYDYWRTYMDMYKYQVLYSSTYEIQGPVHVCGCVDTDIYVEKQGVGCTYVRIFTVHVYGIRVEGNGATG